MRNFYINIIAIFFISVASYLAAQNTVGLLSLDVEKSYGGYNLIFPHNQPNVYLFDQCGQIVNVWEDAADIRPGNSVYLLENGNLIKCKRPNNSIQDPIWAGGGGETVEILDWDNNLLYSYTLNNADYRLHHDVAPMPNGNMLMIAWERMSFEEAVAAGRNPELLAQNELWSEIILEWDPVLDSIVWEWRVQDHLIQDFDPNADNFGVVADHPELIDINYDEHEGHPDWLHVNAIAYNPVLDQFAISVPYFNEFWIVDHGITREEASGPAGDLLYRWGNPMTYDQGTPDDQKLFFQHNVHWANPEAQPGDEAFGLIALFNNRVGTNTSTANLLNTGVDETTMTYSLIDNRFAPADFQRTIMHPKSIIQAFSNSVSSFEILPNGNFLVFAGRWGYAYELTPDTEEVVWEYIVPIKNGSLATQGDTLGISDNLTFRLNRFGADYPAFAGRDLSPKGYIENNPNEALCATLTPTTEIAITEDFKVYPNPASERVTIEWGSGEAFTLEVFDMLGRRVEQLQLSGVESISTVGWKPGVYLLRVNGLLTKRLLIQR